MTELPASLPAATEIAAELPFRTSHRFVLEEMDSYPIWVFRMESELEDEKCDYAVLNAGHLTDSKACTLMLMRIEGDIMLPIINKNSDLHMGAAQETALQIHEVQETSCIQSL